MSLADRLRKVMGVPDPVAPADQKKMAFKAAADRGDEAAAFKCALDFLHAQMFDDAISAFSQMQERFPARKAEWLRWQGQILYIHVAGQSKDRAARIACCERALACYFEAAELGELSQEFNVAELCEAVAVEPSVPGERKQLAVTRYLALFPQGASRKRIEALASK